MKYPDRYLEICEKANDCRRQWNINENDPIDIFAVVQNKIDNLTIIFLKMKGDISGSSYETKNQKIIFINSKHSLGRQRFTLGHELYHLLFEKKFNVSDTSSDSEIEEIANQFSSCLLMSNGALLNYERENNIEEWDLDNIIETEQYFQISHKAMLKRLYWLDKITEDEFEEYLPSIKYNASIRGYSLRLYEPYSPRDNLIIGNLIKLINKAYDDKKISDGKKEELLRNAFKEGLIKHTDD